MSSNSITNGMTLSGWSGESSSKVEEEGEAGRYVEDKNVSMDVI